MARTEKRPYAKAAVSAKAAGRPEPHAPEAQERSMRYARPNLRSNVSRSFIALW